MARPHLRQIKPLLVRLAAHPFGSRIACGLFTVVLSASQRQPIAITRSDGAFRYRFPNGAVLYSAELDLLTPSRLRSQAQTYYLGPFDLQPGDVVVDAGASVGTFTYVAAEIVGPTGRVIAVESHPESYERLRRGVAESSFTNIECVHAALVAVDGDIMVTTADDYRLSSVSTDADAGGEMVPATTLASLAAERNIDRIDLLKMNIEGAEVDALAGASSLAAGGRLGAVAVSCHDFMVEQTGDEGYRTRALVAAWFDDNGYRVDWGSESTTEAPLRDYAWATRR